ncbi:hypothetical protein NGRA_3209 [Nosema granulosis]|uniref:Uncharacterized protein n=1 Tax=Nosema granulosis TaxID=83296 RepID=A0A9P6GV56_9MICR|nr:hypothetical protein NGRA_3209 [Nosema granulosis]
MIRLMTGVMVCIYDNLKYKLGFENCYLRSIEIEKNIIMFYCHIDAVPINWNICICDCCKWIVIPFSVYTLTIVSEDLWMVLKAYPLSLGVYFAFEDISKDAV